MMRYDVIMYHMRFPILHSFLCNLVWHIISKITSSHDSSFYYFLLLDSGDGE